MSTAMVTAVHPGGNAGLRGGAWAERAELVAPRQTPGRRAQNRIEPLAGIASGFAKDKPFFPPNKKLGGFIPETMRLRAMDISK